MRSNREIYLAETLEILKERYDVSLSELIDAYTGEVTVPATIYDSDLTPLEATAQYLIDIRDFSAKEAAQALNRRTSTISAAHNNAKDKGATVRDDPETPHRIKLSAFDNPLSPAEAVVHALKEQGLRNTDIAETIGKDPRNVWQLLKRADKKLGGDAQ